MVPAAINTLIVRHFRNIGLLNLMQYKYRVTRPEIPGRDKWVPRLDDAYDKKWFTNFGPLSQELETKLNQQWGQTNSAFVTTASATSGICAALIANNITGNVILPAFTFPATQSAVRMAGATPVIVDVDRQKWHLCPSALQQALNNTKAEAVVLVCPFGIRQNLAEHIDIAKKRNITVVVDNAAGLGVNENSIDFEESIYEVYSMHATKPFGIGEGGCIVANGIHEHTLRSALNFGLGSPATTETAYWGINGKMSEIHAAIGLSVLETYEKRLSLRRDFVCKYIELFSDFSEVTLHDQLLSSTWQVFPVLMPDENSASRLIAEAGARGLEVRKYYHPSLSKTRNASIYGSCEVSEFLSQRMCCFPVYSYASFSEISEIIDICRTSVESALGLCTKIY